MLRVPFPSYNMPGIGRKRRKRRKAKQRVHMRRRQAKDTAADIQSKKEEKARKRKVYDFMLEEIREAVLRIEANDDALAADDVVADTVVHTIEDAVHSRLPEGTPQEPLTSEIVTVVSKGEKRKAAVEAEKEVEVAAPVKEESRCKPLHGILANNPDKQRISVAVEMTATGKRASAFPSAGYSHGEGGVAEAEGAIKIALLNEETENR